MSQRNFNVNRPRSASRTPYRPQAEDSPKYSTNQRKRISSTIKIEERLMNQQVTYNRRLETLKKTLEQEELKEVQSKPTISSKSRSLAQKAEERMMNQYNYIKNTTEVEANPPQVQPDYTARSSSAIKSLNSNLDHSRAVEKVIKIEKFDSDEKTRTKSLLHLTVLERNKAWVEKKKSKIGIRKRELEEKNLAECTFSPETQNKIKHSRSMRENPNSNTSYVSSPGANETVEVNEAYSGQYRQFGYRPIAPYQVKVAFKCGIDLNSFLRRAK